MENLNIIEILELGLPGLVFLLSVLSYRLLTKEQTKQNPSEEILRSIKQYMHVNIFLAVVTVMGSMIYVPDTTAFAIHAKTSDSTLIAGNAAVCTNAAYANRHLLLKDPGTGKLIQVFANSVIPCLDGEHISLNQSDAINLGWSNGVTDSLVEVVTAMPGQKFVI